MGYEDLKEDLLACEESGAKSREESFTWGWQQAGLA